MARYHGVAKEIGEEVERFCNEHNLSPEQRVELVQLMFSSTRIASGGRLTFQTRVNSYHIIADGVSGVKAKHHTVEKKGGRTGGTEFYESVRFEMDDSPPPEE